MFVIPLSQFSPDQPVSSETVGYVKRPGLNEKIHCVAFVVNASKIMSCPKGLSTTFQQLREHISDLGKKRTNKQLNMKIFSHTDTYCSSQIGII